MNNLQIIIIDVDLYKCEVFKQYFKNYSDIEIINSSLEDYQGKYDCIVSPANSFGLMDGGFDYAITQKFGETLMRDVQRRIIREYAGLQPVGTSFLVYTYNHNHPYLVHTPTMELPCDIRNTINVYLATKAALLIIRDYSNLYPNIIRTVLFPMLGGGCGMVSPESMAKQMKLAYEHVYNPMTSITWESSNKRMREIIECLR